MPLSLKSLTMAILSLSALILRSQQSNFIKYSGYFKLTDKIFNDLNHAPISADERYLYVLEDLSIRFNLKKIDIKTEKTVNLSVIISDSLQREIRKRGLFGMVADSTKLVLLLDNMTCYVLDSYKEGYKYNKNKIQLKNLPQQLFIHDNNLICCYNYFFHPRDNSKWFYIESYDLNNHDYQILYEAKEKYPFLLIYSPKRLFSLRNHSLIFSSKSERIIYELNLNTLHLDSIVIKGEWTYLNDSINEFLTHFFHTDFFEGFQDLDEVVNYKISMCKNLGFYKDSWAALNYNQPATKDCQLNVNWDFVNIYTGEYKTYKERNCGKIDVKKKMTPYDIDIFSINSGLLIIHNDCILKIIYDAPINPLGSSFNEYYQLRRKYLRRKKPLLIVQKYALF